MVKALTGREPKVCRMRNGTNKNGVLRGRLEGFKLYDELADAIKKPLEETRGR